MSLNLKTPGEIFEANAGYSRELSLSNTSGETLEEELTWGEYQGGTGVSQEI